MYICLCFKVACLDTALQDAGKISVTWRRLSIFLMILLAFIVSQLPLHSILMILLVFILNFHFLFKSFTWRRLSIFLLCPSYFRGQNLNFPHDLSHLCCKSMFIISIFHLLCMPPAAHFTFSFVLLFIQKI